MKMRSLSELFAIAQVARVQDDFTENAVGARGHGFALASQAESNRFRAGGAKLVSLPSFSKATLTAHVIGLTRGQVKLRPHIEELFQLTLCVALPSGKQRAVGYYFGPTGHALGDLNGLSRHEGEVAAEAFEEALRKAPAVDFQLQVDSDFGKAWLVVKSGQESELKKRDPDVAEPPEPGLADDRALREALAAPPTEEPCEAFDLLSSAWDLTRESARRAHARTYEKTTTLLWRPAFAELETALDGHGALSPAMQRVAPVLLSPQKGEVEISPERASHLYDRWHTKTYGPDW